MIWPSDALLLMITLIGKVVAARRAELGHEHGEPAVADEGDALAARMGDLVGDRVGQSGRHGGQVSRQVEVALDRGW